MIAFPADALNVHSPMDLITPNMLNMELFQASREFKYTKVANSHPLATSLALHFQPNHIAYNCLQITLVQCFGVLQNLPPMLSTPLPSKTKVATLIWQDVPKMAQVPRDGMPWLSHISFPYVNVDAD